MKSLTLLLPVLLLPLLLPPAGADAQQDAQHEAKIQQALAAAPSSISEDAEVRDWDDTVLREGSNGWICFPDVPESPGVDPMCLDEPWREFADAWVNQRRPQVDRMGFGYMLVGDASYSNVDPYAEGPTEDNEWMEEGVPHVMIVVPDPEMLQGVSTDHTNGGPWVMWRNTPYAHIMVPLPNGRAHQ